MKKLIFGLLTLSFLMTSCDDGWGIFDRSGIKGTGAVEKMTRDVKDFKSVNLAASGDVFVKQSTTFKVEVEGQKNIVDVLETVVEDGVLVIKFKKGTWNVQFEKLNIYVEMPSVESLEITGSGNLTTESAFSGDNITLYIAGSGNIKAEQALTAKTLKVSLGGSGDIEAAAITTSELTAKISGSGNLDLAGTADKATYSIAGSGDIDARNVKSKATEANVSGSGNISCHADESIDAHSSGSGDIEYSGNATVVKTKASGSGEIFKK